MNSTVKTTKNKTDDNVDMTEAARTAPLSTSNAPDANVAPDGNCILAMDGEMARPDSGDPCDAGNDDARAYESAGVFESNTTKRS